MLSSYKCVLPPLGQRILKTAAAVFICLVLYMLQGFHGNVGSSVVTAIIVMQPFAEDSKTFARDRIFGTVLGAAWGLAFLLLLSVCPVLGKYQILLYGLMAMFVILAIYSTVVIKKSTLASLTAIVLMSTIVEYPNVDAPLVQTLEHLADTIVGTVVAICVNVFRLPRKRNPDCLFFVRTRDLVQDRFRHIPSSVHIALDKLYQDGAKICLVSRWAPAFIISQMGLLKVNAPMIIMDGAALYDIRENQYLDVAAIPGENAALLQKLLDRFEVGANLYCINHQDMSIFHQGSINSSEEREREEMKRSPYRHYADGLPRPEDVIAFIRVIDTTEKIEELAETLCPLLPEGMFRTAVHRDGRQEGVSGLFFYDPEATVENRKRQVTEMLSEKEKRQLTPIDLQPRTTHYTPEHDALMLLGRLKNIYEPVRLRKNAGAVPRR